MGNSQRTSSEFYSSFKKNMIVSQPKADKRVIVCWKCQRGNVQLFRTVPKIKGKHKQYKQEKNIAYVCTEDRINGRPNV